MAKEYLEKLSVFVKEATAEISDEINLECKHFFSGAALYANYRICITLTPNGLGIKLPKDVREKLLKNKEAMPLKYFKSAPIKTEYVLFPDGLEHGGKVYHQYVNESIAYVLSLPKPKRKLDK